MKMCSVRCGPAIFSLLILYEVKCHTRACYIQTYKIITGIYDKVVTTGLFNLRKDSNTRGQWYKIVGERPRLEVRKH